MMKAIPRLNVSEAAYLAVKQAVLSIKYSPGERIGIEELCRKLEVSRTPVFDALNRLEVEGVVKIIPRKGVYLVAFSADKAKEIYVVREALEGLAAKLAAKNLTRRHIEVLEAALSRQETCLKQHDIEGYAVATIKFHDIIAEAAGNKTLKRMLDSIYAQMAALRLRTLYLDERLSASYAEHQRVFNALLRRDPEAAELEARKHMETTTAVALDILTRDLRGQSASDK